MNDDNNILVRVTIGAICFFLGTLILTLLLHMSGNTYRNGQIDALTGKIKYELTVNADSSKTWKEIKIK